MAMDDKKVSNRSIRIRIGYLGNGGTLEVGK